MPSALITGITGQDGGYLAERLIDEGYQVHGLIREGARDRIPAHLVHECVHLHEGDLAEGRGLARIIEGIVPDEIYNLAGISSVHYSWDHPVQTGDISGLGAARILESVARHAAHTRFVQASSAEIFGNAAASPQDEQTPVNPVSPYGAAKAYAHQLVGIYRAKGFHASAMILYNHESPRRPLDFVTRKICRAAAEISLGRADELVLGNLDARRDWGWAPDYVDAMVRAARHDTGGDYVIATGRSATVADFVTAAFAHVGITDWTHLVRTDPRFVRPVDAVAQVGDATRARMVLGWTPTVGLQQIVARMVDHDLQELRGAPRVGEAARS